ncbi:MAG: SoxR reducing system RseC family protein [Symbiobacteriaceae bacterium]|nr:SoxR reducing system RseC family protein [Symbiobacteriaceae bacterium]
MERPASPLTPTGTVTAVAEGKAWVHMVRHSACGNCGACALGFSTDTSITVIAADPGQVEVGQEVELYFPPTQGMTAALVVYGTPLLVLILSSLVLSRVVGYLGSLAAALTSCILSFASFFLLRFGEQKRRQDPKLLPQIKQVLER